MSKDIHVRKGPWLIVFGKGQEQCTRFGIFCLHGTQSVLAHARVVVWRIFYAVQTVIMPEIH